MRNNHKVLSIALLFLAVSLFGCGGDYSILVINTPPNPDIVASPITLSNLSPKNITLFKHNGPTIVYFSFNQSGGVGNLTWYCYMNTTWETLNTFSGVFGPSPVVYISLSIDPSNIESGKSGHLEFKIQDSQGTWSNVLTGTWNVI